MVTDNQVRILIKQINQSKTFKIAAAKAGMSEKTARKYRRLGKLPSQCKSIHDWKTHADVFEDDWPWVQDFLETNSALEAIVSACEWSHLPYLTYQKYLVKIPPTKQKGTEEKSGRREYITYS